MRTKPVSTGEALLATFFGGFLLTMLGFLAFAFILTAVSDPWILLFLIPFVIVFIVFRFTPLGRKLL